MGESHKPLFKWIVFVEAIVSFIISALVVFAYWKFQRIQNFGFRLVMILCLTNCFNSIGYLLVLSDYQKNHWSCQLSGFFLLSSSTTSFVIISLIAYTILLITVYNYKHTERKIMILSTIGFIFPAISSSIPAFLGKFSPQTSYYCFLDQEQGWYFIVFGVVMCFGVLWMSLFFFLYCFFKIQRELRIVGLDKNSLVLYKKLLYFPLIILLCWLPATVNRIFMWIYGPDSKYNGSWVYVLHISSSILGNILTGLMYGFNEQVKREFRRLVFSNQSHEDYKMLDDIDNEKKIQNHPTLSNQVNSQNQSNSGVGSSGSDISFFFSSEEQKQQSQKNFIPRLFNYSYYADEVH